MLFDIPVASFGSIIFVSICVSVYILTFYSTYFIHFFITGDIFFFTPTLYPLISKLSAAVMLTQYQDYNISCCCICVWNLVADIEGET
jgi:hypothetical protein